MSRSSFIGLSVSAIATLATTSSVKPCHAQSTLSSLVKSPVVPSSSSIPSIHSTSSFSSSSSPTSSSSSAKLETLLETISGFVSGASLTATKSLVKYPLDTATVRLQIPSTPYSLFRPLELFGGSYRGISSVLLTNVPGGAIFFAVKDSAKSVLREAGLPRWITTCIAVGVANPPYWLVRNPSEVVKTRQQAGVEGYGEDTNALGAFRTAVRDGGVADLFSGYWENVIYAYPADVLKFLCYEWLVTSGASGGGGGGKPSPLRSAVCGATATAVAQAVTTPLDVVRNRIMADAPTTKIEGGGKKNDDDEVDRKESLLESLQRVANEEGVKGLFAGVSPRIGKAILSGAIQFATYEETKKSIRDLFSKKFL